MFTLKNCWHETVPLLSPTAAARHHFEIQMLENEKAASERRKASIVGPRRHTNPDLRPLLFRTASNKPNHRGNGFFTLIWHHTNCFHDLRRCRRRFGGAAAKPSRPSALERQADGRFLCSFLRSGGTSTLRLSSVRQLPGQLQELYQQGFVLATVHPFIHPCGPESNSLQHRLYRAILLRLTDG